MKFYITLIFLLLTTLCNAQVTQVTVKSCNDATVQCVTEADSFMVFCVRVNPKTGSSGNYTLEWGDGQSEVINLNAEKDYSHTYDLRSFIENCNKARSDRFSVNVENDDDVSDNNGFNLYFDKGAEAKLSVQNACIGQTVEFRNQSCPNVSGIEYEWQFSDGSTSVLKTPNNTFTDPNINYSGILIVTPPNSCKADTAAFSFSMKDKPKADIDYSGFTIANGDTVFCAGNGDKISLDGTGSTDETGYSWSISGGQYEVLAGATNSGNLEVQFKESNVYSVSLTAKNECGNSSPVKCEHRVVARPSIDIESTADKCEAFDYSIPNPKAGVTYTLNGAAFQSTETKNLDISSTAYIVEGTLAYECGLLTVSDTFFVREKEIANITNALDTILCISNLPFELIATPAGGTWTGKLQNEGASSADFIPDIRGAYSVKYQIGEGTCATEEEINIEVKGIEITATDEFICDGDDFLKLSASPNGGTWSTTGCFSCLINDTLDIAGMSTPTLDLTYTVRNDVGGAICESQKNIKVNKGDPVADFDMEGGCLGEAAQVVNNSTGAESYEWTVNNSGLVDYAGVLPIGLSLSAGSFTLTLKAKAGTCEHSVSKSVDITTPPEPVIISSSLLEGCSPLLPVINLNGSNRNDVDYEWVLNGQSISSQFSPGHIQLENIDLVNKDYILQATASNACDSFSDEVLLTVFPGVKAEIGIDSTTFRCGSTSVKFADKSIGKYAPAIWDFGDGSMLTSNLDTISHFFPSADTTITYEIKQIVENRCGQDSATVSIEVFPENVNPFFTMSKNEVCVGETLKLNDATTPNPIRWEWFIDDQKVGVYDSLEHKFAVESNAYTIRMLAITPCGTDSLERQIKVIPAPESDFALSVDEICFEESVDLENLSKGNVQSFIWYFPDSIMDSLSYNQSFKPSTSGQIPIKLQVFGSSKACTSEKTINLEVHDLPETAFISHTDTAGVCEGEFLNLEVINAKGNQSYFWYMNDSLVSNAPMISKSATKGIYSVKLAAISSYGCKDSLEKVDYLTINSCKIAFPEVFTPNGDGFSEFFYVTATDGIELVENLRIRNRWGEIVFEKESFEPNILSNGWDGFMGSKAQPSGEYTYEVIYNTSQNTSKKVVGTFSLLR